VLAGDIGDGSWAIFYDANQNIYNGLKDTAMDRLTRARPARSSLRINCRNTRAIATATAVLSGLKPAPVLKLESPEVEAIWYRDHAHQKRETSRVIRRWLNDGVKSADLAVISCRTQRNSGLAEGLEETVPYQLIEWDKDEPPPENIIPFSTVHSFKGLESDLVVMADIGEPAKLGDGFLSPLYYVGASRARVMLVLSISEAMRRDYADLEVS